ncbi:hypothetical protein GCM10027258_70760 [Amycolatopsis stemonae]
MWQYALWGLIGAAANRALLLLEASERAKKWPWTPPDGPGGGLYATSVGLHLGIATAATAALATTTIISNGFVAFGFGAGAPVVVKKACRYAIRLLPPEEPTREIGGGD